MRLRRVLAVLVGIGFAITVGLLFARGLHRPTPTPESPDPVALPLEKIGETADALVSVALVEQRLDHWQSAVKHLEQAQSLDPRNELTARRLAAMELWLHRFGRARAAADRALALTSGYAVIVEEKAMVPLAQGDLSAARAVLDSMWSTDSTGLAVEFGANWDLYWVLDDAQQRFLLSLPVASVGTRSLWATVRAEVFADRGDQVHARAYADTACRALEGAFGAALGHAQSHALLGLMLAYEGRKAEAMREARYAVAMVPAAQDGYIGPYYEQMLARTYVLVGEQDEAIDALAQVLRVPFWVTRAELRIDPSFAALRNDPKFQRLVASN